MLYSMSWSTVLTWFCYTLAGPDIARFSILTVVITLTSLCMNKLKDFSLSITIYITYLVNSTIDGQIPAAA